jgi:hypothetical protein
MPACLSASSQASLCPCDDLVGVSVSVDGPSAVGPPVAVGPAESAHEALGAVDGVGCHGERASDPRRLEPPWRRRGRVQ